MKFDTEKVKQELYTGVISDVLDGMGYRDQALPGGRERLDGVHLALQHALMALLCV